MKRRLLATLAILSSSLSLNFLMAGRALAASAEFCGKTSASFLKFPTWYEYLSPQFVNGQCIIQASFPEDIGKIALAVVEILLRLGGLAAIGFVVYGGFNYITSQGEPEKTKNARQTIMNAIIGLVIATIATVIVAFIGREFATK